MNKGVLVCSLLLLGMSLAYATIAVVQVIRGVWSMWSVPFFGCAGFHGIMAVDGAILLMKGVPARAQPAEEAQP